MVNGRERVATELADNIQVGLGRTGVTLAGNLGDGHAVIVRLAAVCALPRSGTHRICVSSQRMPKCGSTQLSVAAARYRCSGSVTASRKLVKVHGGMNTTHEHHQRRVAAHVGKSITSLTVVRAHTPG